MSITVKLNCDGDGCYTCVELDNDLLDYNCEYPIPDNWREIDGYHYCPTCTKRIIESGEMEG